MCFSNHSSFAGVLLAEHLIFEELYRRVTCEQVIYFHKLVICAVSLYSLPYNSTNTRSKKALQELGVLNMYLIICRVSEQNELGNVTGVKKRVL